MYTCEENSGGIILPSLGRVVVTLFLVYRQNAIKVSISYASCLKIAQAYTILCQCIYKVVQICKIPTIGSFPHIVNNYTLVTSYATDSISPCKISHLIIIIETKPVFGENV